MDVQKNSQPAKRDWVRPELKQLVAGAAESQRGARADGGGGAQGS
jgi:hypothetical protein